MARGADLSALVRAAAEEGVLTHLLVAAAEKGFQASFRNRDGSYRCAVRPCAVEAVLAVLPGRAVAVVEAEEDDLVESIL